jgi:hypothetical protein
MGMEAVCRIDHFAGLVAARPENRRVLLDLEPARFIEAMLRWRDSFLVGSHLPVMGLDDEDLARVGVPTAIVPFYDRMHPRSAVAHAHRLICGSRLFDHAPARWMDQPVYAADDPREFETVAAIVHEIAMNIG